MKDARARVLAARAAADLAGVRAAARIKSISNIGTSIRTGVLGAFNNATPKTWHHFQAVAAPFEAVRVLFANGSTTQDYTIAGFKVASAANPKTDKLMNNVSWVAGTIGGAPSAAVGLAPGAAQMKVLASDWLTLPSIPRTDGALPIIACRVYISTAANLTMVGNSSYDMSGWATQSRDRLWSAFYQDGDQVTSTTGFSSTTLRNLTPVLGFQYMARGRVVTVMTNGDSIDWGASSTLVTEGFWAPAIWNIADGGPVPVEQANIAWPGTNMLSIEQRVSAMLNAGVIPDLLTMPIGSPNNMGGTTITSGQIASQRLSLVRALGAAAQSRVPVLLRTIIPSNPAAGTYDWGATDSLRRDYNEYWRTQAATGYEVIDADAAIRGITDPDGQVLFQDGTVDATLHPNQAGNNLIIPVAQSELRAALNL